MDLSVIAEQYGHAIASIVVYAVIAQVLNAMTGIRKGAAGLQPGASHPQDYGDASYRLDRTYMNTVEMLGFTVALIVAAILVGANPFWVNLLATLSLLLRLAANVVYMRGIGAPYGGIRTQLIIGISLCNFGLAGLTLWKVFFA